MFSFAEYLQVNEAYLPIMKTMFTSKQLSEIGKYLAKIGISAQDSDFTHIKKKNWKNKFAVNNGIAIAKQSDSTFAIIAFANQKTYKVDYIEGGDTLSNKTAADFLNDATDIFVLETKADVRHLQRSRSIAQQINDPLTIMANKLAKAKENTNSYASKIKQEANKYGFEFEDLYLSNINGRLSPRVYIREKRMHYVRVTSDYTSKGVEFFIDTLGAIINSNKLEQYKKDVNDAIKFLEFCNNIDFNKLPVIDE